VQTSHFSATRADRRHRDAVLSLLAEHLPGTPVAERHAWLYEQNPHGRAVTVIAFDETTGEPLGLTSVFPRKLLVAGKTRLGAIGGDGYVRPSARRRGVATALHRASLRAMQEEGIEAMFGPPEPYNLRALERAGARIVTHVRRYARPKLVQNLLRPFARRTVHLEAITGHDKRVDEVFSRVADDRLVIPVRDAAFYAWRFVSSPAGRQRAFVVNEHEKPVGLCVLEPRSGRVAVVDLFAAPADYGRILRALASTSEALSMVVQLNERGPGAAKLAGAGFFPRERKPFQVLARHDATPALLDASRWYYTWGDGDLDQVL